MICIEQYGATAIMQFPYDVEAVDIIRSIAGRRWDPERKYWTIQTIEVALAARRFTNAGFTVTIDGLETGYENSSSATGASDPIGALLVATPSRLRTGVYRALAKVLHPDAGGDVGLMAQLNRAYQEHK
jgi:hypothetical protein